MSLADLTAESVLSAIREFEVLGEEEFLDRYGFRDSKGYWLVHQGRRYPSKAICGVAHRYLSSSSEPLTAAEFSGGKATVEPTLRRLGFKVESQGRNPNWTRDELILALDLYMTNPASPPGKDSAEVLALSRLLNRLHAANGEEASETLRNPNGVYLKLMNLRSHDPSYLAQGKVGMKAGNALEGMIWEEYTGRRSALSEDAATIRRALEGLEQQDQLPQADVEYEGEEGGVIMRLHRSFERDRKLIAEKKKAAKAAGQLLCEACGFDFRATYGELGADFIEVHHARPVHQLAPGSRTKLSDLILLCANCHRMTHRRRVPLTLAELKAVLNGE